MITYDEALQRVIESIAPLEPRETSLHEASGLVLAKPAKALWQMPRWDNSAMDGYAVRSEDVAAATLEVPVMLKVIAEVPAGAVAAGADESDGDFLAGGNRTVSSQDGCRHDLRSGVGLLRAEWAV
jgi:molybdopterin biosynthesis enzyme